MRWLNCTWFQIIIKQYLRQNKSAFRGSGSYSLTMQHGWGRVLVVCLRGHHQPPLKELPCHTYQIPLCKMMLQQSVLLPWQWAGISKHARWLRLHGAGGSWAGAGEEDYAQTQTWGLRFVLSDHSWFLSPTMIGASLKLRVRLGLLRFVLSDHS